MAPEIVQRLIHLPRNSVRDEHLPVQPLGQIQEPTGPVHGRTDDRKIQPVCGADIAVSHLANMQGQAMEHWWVL